MLPRRNHATPYKTWCYVKEFCLLGCDFMLPMKNILNSIGFHQYIFLNNLKKLKCWSENRVIFTILQNILRRYLSSIPSFKHCPHSLLQFLSFRVNSTIYTGKVRWGTVKYAAYIYNKCLFFVDWCMDQSSGCFIYQKYCANAYRRHHSSFVFYIFVTLVPFAVWSW